jgi:hypothetical protein
MKPLSDKIVFKNAFDEKWDGFTREDVKKAVQSFKQREWKCGSEEVDDMNYCEKCEKDCYIVDAITGICMSCALEQDFGKELIGDK